VNIIEIEIIKTGEGKYDVNLIAAAPLEKVEVVGVINKED